MKFEVYLVYKADISQLIYATEKYDNQGLKALICFKASIGDIKMRDVADMITMADLLQSKELEAVVLMMFRENRKLLEDLEFRRKLEDSLKTDLLYDFMLKF